MNVKITKRFKDKNTKKWHEFGDEISVTPERYEEIKTACQIIDKKSDSTVKEHIEEADKSKQKSTK